MRKNMKRFLLEIAGFLGCICFCGCNSGSGSTSVCSLSKEQAAISVSTDDFIYADTDEIIIPAEKPEKHAYLITYNNAYPESNKEISTGNSIDARNSISLGNNEETNENINIEKKYSLKNLNSNNYPLAKKVSRGINSSTEPNYDACPVNGTVNLYVTEYPDTVDENGDWKDSGWKTRTAVKKCEGSFCNVWYMEDTSKSFISLTDSNFSSLAEKFDTIFQKEKGIFGTNIPDIEYRNTISKNACLRKVNILVYDIGLDAKEDQTGGTFGYFHDKDFFERTTSYGDFTCGFSNLGEFIYVDSYFLSKYPEQIYSTLAHEFQHLLFYVNKWLNNGVKTITWNTEMMSMLAEEILQNDLGISDKDSPKHRLACFKIGSQFGFTDKAWTTFDDGTYEYANTYAFGSFLLHNYGVSYIKKLVSNSYSGTAMITNSLPAGETFDTMLYKFGKSYIDGYYPEINETNFNIPAIDLLDSKWTYSEDYIKKIFKNDGSLFASYNPLIISADHYIYPLFPQGFYVVDLGVIGKNSAVYSGLKHSDSNVFRFIYLK